MRSEWAFTHTSAITAPPSVVWARVVSPEGINDEMRPWLTMSVPAGADGVTIDNLDVGVPIGRAPLRLFGFIPFDYDDLTIAELEPGRRFREESTMRSMTSWTHDRTVTATADGNTQLIDRISFRPRAPLRPLGPVLARCLRAYFGHRHRRLKRALSQVRTYASPG